MTPSKKSQKPIKKSPTAENRNLRRTSILYFQIGLIVCLLFSYVLLETKFESKLDHTVYKMPVETEPQTEIPLIKKRKSKIDIPEVKTPETTSNDYQKVDDDTPDFIIPEKKDNETPEKTIENNFQPLEGNKGEVKLDDPDDEVLIEFIKIEEAPLYPGCEREKTNEGRKKCMSQKLTRYVQRRFNTDIANDRGLSGRQKIYTQFKIDKEGHVKDIRVRSKDTLLSMEAIRVVNKIPKMTPGRQRDKNIEVLYTLPILLDVR